MRIDGYVPTKNDIPVWGFLAPTEQDVKEILFKLLPEDSEWGEWEEEGWKIVRVGDVDSIRDEALEAAVNAVKRAYQEEPMCQECRNAAIDFIRAMKAKP